MEIDPKAQAYRDASAAAELVKKMLDAVALAASAVQLVEKTLDNCGYSTAAYETRRAVAIYEGAAQIALKLLQKAGHATDAACWAVRNVDLALRETAAENTVFGAGARIANEWCKPDREDKGEAHVKHLLRLAEDATVINPARESGQAFTELAAKVMKELAHYSWCLSNDYRLV